MPMIQLEQAKAGDVLAADLHGADERLLCKKDTELTARLLERLEQLGVTMLAVQAETSEQQKARQLTIDAALDQRFGPVS